MTGQKPTGSSVRALVELLVEVEKRFAAGPWDDWDGKVLEQWRTIARDRLYEVCTLIDAELHRKMLVEKE